MNVQLSSGPTPLGAPRSTHYLPYVANVPAITTIGREDKEWMIFDLMRQHPQQGRKELMWHVELANVAYAKCVRQAQEGWTGHVDPDGHGPNWSVRMYCCDLPSWYPQADDANNIESLAHGGVGKVASVWDAWMNSEPHRIHILGLNDFYAEQTHVGIAYYYNEHSEYKHYWSIITAPEES